MQLASKIFQFYVNASIHVAIAVCSLVGVTMLEYDLKFSDKIWGFVFFGTITGYNFVKYAGIASIHRKRLKDSLKSNQLFSFLSFFGMIFFGAQLSVKVLIATAIFAAFTFFYAVPLMKYKSLRSLGGIKIFIVAMVWAGVTVIIPMVAAGITLNMDCWITFFQRFLIVIALTLPFEIRDLQYDIASLQTLPQILGLKKTKILGIVLLFGVLLLDGFKDEFTYQNFTSLILICLLIGGLLIFSKERQTKYFAAFWVESIPVLWIAFLLILTELF